MRRNCVGIEITSDRVDVVLIRGDGVAAAGRFPLAPAVDGPAWSAAVRSVEPQLARFVEQHSAAGLPATVLYRSPSQVVDFPHLQVKSLDEASNAAVLSCTDAIANAIGGVACDAAVIGRDRLGGHRRWHVAVAADRNDAIEAMESLVTGAGLSFAGAVPIDVAIVLAVAQGASAKRADHQTQGWLHLGMQTSVFMVRIGSAIRFLRRINLGLESIAASLTRPIYQHGRGEPVQLGVDAARRMLFENGIPARDQLVHEQLRLHGCDTLPLMQPVLQRLLVELRQSLRFGLEENERAGLRVSVCGPGVSVPRLVELLAGELQIETAPSCDAGDASPFLAGSPSSELVLAMREHALLGRLRLLPPLLAARQRTGRSQRLMWAGAAIAVAMLAGEWLVAQRDLRVARSRMQQLETSASQFESLRAMRDRLVGASAAIEQLEQDIQREIGSRVDLRAVMNELTAITPPTIQLTSIDFAREADTVTGSVVGYVLRSSPDGDHHNLEHFMAQLKQSPLLSDVTLRDVRNTAIDDSDVLRFSANFKPVVWPAADGTIAIASGTGEAAP